MADTISLQTYLLMQLAEEASEVAQAVSKCVLYSPKHTAPEYTHSNIENLEMELNDLLGTVRLLKYSGLNLELSKEAQYAKAVKITQYAAISAVIGTLKESDVAYLRSRLGDLRVDLKPAAGGANRAASD